MRIFIIFLIVIVALGLGLGLGLGIGLKKDNPEQLQAKGISQMYKRQKMTGITLPKSFNEGKFYNGGAIGNKVIFAPFKTDKIGIYDMITGEFKLSGIDMSKQGIINNSITNRGYFSGAVAVNDTTVVLIPYNTDWICEYNVVDDTFKKITELSGIFGPAFGKNFVNGISYENKVVFVPFNAAHIVIYDKTTKGVNTIDISSMTGVTTGMNFNDSTIIGTKIYFAPFSARTILSLDMSNNTLATLNFYKDDGVADGIEYPSIGAAFGGVASIGSNLYFAPYGVNTIVKYDTSVNTITQFNLDERMVNELGEYPPYKYNGAAALNGNVYFSPYGTSFFTILQRTEDDQGEIKEEVLSYQIKSGELDFETEEDIVFNGIYLYCGIAYTDSTIVYIPFNVDTIIAYSEQNTWIYPIQTEKTDGLVKFRGCDKSYYFTGGNVDKIHENKEKQSKYAFANCDKNVNECDCNGDLTNCGC